MQDQDNELPVPPVIVSMRCGYCGRENVSHSECCSGCGTAFPATLLESGDPQLFAGENLEPEQPLRAGRATLILLIFLGAQVFGGFVAGLFGAISAHGGGHAEVQAAVGKLMPWTVLLAMLAGGVAMLVASLQWVRPALKDNSPAGAAWTLGPPKALLKGALLGLGIAISYLLIASLLNGLKTSYPKGPIQTMAETSGYGRIILFVVAIALAPPIEELLFRGVLYAGFRNSYGAVKAAWLTTTIFLVLHFSEIFHFPPGAIGITAVALGALWLRLKFGAVGPAIAAHLAFNLVNIGLYLGASSLSR